MDQLAFTLDALVRNVNDTIDTLRRAGYGVELFVLPAEDTWVSTFGARVRSPEMPERAAGEWWCSMEVPLISDDREFLHNAHRQAQQEIGAANDEENENDQA
jgi:hypothetical protein